MYQFNEKELTHLRSKVDKNPEVVEQLKKEVQEIYIRPITVPTTGIANWELYYYCPKHSVKLEFNLDKPYEHRCPIDGEVFTGEPYDSTWWGYRNIYNYHGVYKLGLVYLLTQEKSYGEKAKAILLEYATHYPSYKEHGDIPYNEPGKAFAQALDEAIFIRTLVCGYDLIEDLLNEQEKEFIKSNLFLEGALFLKEKRTNQLHNHEVIIDAAIGTVGILLKNQELIDFAVYEPYGIIYQLEKGVLKDKIWFEGAVSYHFFALQNFLGYEKFARYTEHSQLNHPNYREMILRIIDILQPDYTFPLINDTCISNASLNSYNLFEFTYNQFKEEKILQILQHIYKSEPRVNMEAFFYGVDELPQAETIQLAEFHDVEGSGLTVIRGEDKRYLLFKHSPYGGEHDHYDRLGIAYLAHGKRIAPDLGTTGYGAVLHYDYYKNTGSHNTVMINEQNQAPANCKVYEYIKDAEKTYIDAGVTWEKYFEMPDSFTIKQWDEASYEGVSMRRKILWLHDYFIEVFTVENVRQYSIDWITHVCGERVTKRPEEYSVDNFSIQKPFKYIKDITAIEGLTQIQNTWDLGEVKFNITSYVNGVTTYYGKGPDNPSVEEVSYMIQRVVGEKALFVNVYESYKKESSLEEIEIQPYEKEVVIKVKKAKSENPIKEWVIRL